MEECIAYGFVIFNDAFPFSIDAEHELRQTDYHQYLMVLY